MTCLPAEDLALIGLWARARWLEAAQSIARGTCVRPTLVGGEIPRSWKGSPPDPALAILAPAWSWSADNRSIFTGANRYGHDHDDAPGFECSWTTVSRWLHGFTSDERGEAGRVHSAYYAAYGYRDGEFSGGHTMASWDAARELYDARMRDGAQLGMAWCRIRFAEILRPHLELPVVDGLFELVAS